MFYFLLFSCFCLLISLVGFFAVVNGRRVILNRPGPIPKSTPFIVYNSAINFKGNNSIPLGVELRVYGSQSAPIYPNHTVLYVVARAYIPPNDIGILDPFICVPVPGDPSDREAYDMNIPDCEYPFIIGLGNTASHPSGAELKNHKLFDMSIGEYVTGETRSSSIVCGFNAQSPRWINTPLPSANSCTMVMGAAQSRFSDGRIHVDLDNLVLNVGSHSSIQTNDVEPSTPKRRKFNAFGGSPVSPSTPMTSSSMVLPNPSMPVAQPSLTFASSSTSTLDQQPSVTMASTNHQPLVDVPSTSLDFPSQPESSVIQQPAFSSIADGLRVNAIAQSKDNQKKGKKGKGKATFIDSSV